jgi:hypothetical protein
LCVQNMLTILGSLVNIIGGDLYDHLVSTRVFTMIVIKTFILALKIMRKMVAVLIRIW